MISCGIEEPLQSNEQLYAVSEQGGQIELSTFAEPRLCRYSFTGFTPGAWSVLVNAIVRKHFQGNLNWVLLWAHLDTGDLKMRSRIRTSRLAAQGFRTKIVGNVGLGVLPYTGVEADSFHPVGVVFHPAGDGVLLLTACSEDVEALLAAQSPGATITCATATREFAPSQAFLSWLSSVQLQILYTRRDYLERPGLVLLTQNQLDIPSLINEGVIEHVERGSSASTVWTQVANSAPPNAPR